MSGRILIADDEALIRDMLSASLRARGHHVEQAEDGVVALEKIAAMRPDLVLLDLMMPRLDGFGVLAALDGSPGPMQVIMLTARAGQAVLQDALEAGADDYISKPFHLGEVVARVEAHLRIARYAAELHQRQQDSEILLEISHRLTGRLEFRAILQEVLQRVATVLDIERGSIVMVQEGSPTARVVASSDDADLTDIEIQIAGYPEIRRVMETRAPLIVSDISADPLFDPVKVKMAQVDVRSAALFPMLHGDTCVGVLFLRSTRPRHDFGAREQQFGQIVANASAVAVRNAQVFATVREESDRINTARERVEERLRFVQRYEDFFEGAADGVFITDPGGRVLFMNRKAEALTGTPRAHGCGGALEALIWPESAADITALLERARADDFDQRVDVRLGIDREVSVGVARVPGDNVFSLTARDVTEERTLARELAHTKDFLQRLIDASPSAVVTTDMRGDVMVFNKAAERLFDQPAAEIVGVAHVRQLYPPGGVEETLALLRLEAHGGPGRIVPSVARDMVDREGRLIPVLLTAALVSVADQDVAVVMVLQDQRERLQIEGQLKKAQSRLQESEKIKLLAELAGTAAHELNQPLTSVVGYAELLRRRLGDDPLNQKAVDTIEREAQRMADIVKKIGQLTRYETKPYGGHTRIIDLSASSMEVGPDGEPSEPSEDE